MVTVEDIDHVFEMYERIFHRYVGDPLWPAFKFPLSDNEEAFRNYAVEGYDVVIGHGYQFNDAALALGRTINWSDFKDKLFPILAAFSVVGMITFKVFAKYKNTKEKHQARLMKTLYFHNLDNNGGVFDFLVNEAEEEECKEIILAYYFLLAERNASGLPFTREELDDRIEEWMQEKFGVAMDFEVGDAVRKLEEKGILEQKDGRYSVPSIRKTLETLDGLWDNFFPYNNEATAES